MIGDWTIDRLRESNNDGPPTKATFNLCRELLAEERQRYPLRLLRVPEFPALIARARARGSLTTSVECRVEVVHEPPVTDADVCAALSRILLIWCQVGIDEARNDEPPTESDGGT